MWNKKIIIIKNLIQNKYPGSEWNFKYILVSNNNAQCMQMGSVCH